MAKQAFSVTFDSSELEKGLNKLDGEVDKWWREARERMADTLLLLSRFEVPHDTGQLQISGHSFFDAGENSWNVAYNTPYATYLHEGMRRDGSHLIINYQKGRKGKYLEDPLLKNMSRWNKIGSDYVGSKLNGKI